MSKISDKLNADDLKNLQNDFTNLPVEEQAKIVGDCPPRLKIVAYLKYCKPHEILALIELWKKTGNDQMLRLMTKKLKKHKKYKNLF